jgi:DNA-binding NarL/FixJ family response regulator
MSCYKQTREDSSDMKNIRTIIVDDHRLVREMWNALFANHPVVKVVGESGELNEAIELIRILKPDLVLLDINLAQSSGFDAVPLIRKFSPVTRIIAVSMHNQPAYAKKMFKLGVKGYVTKNSTRQEMLAAVEEVMNGGTYVCAEIKEGLSGQMLCDTPDSSAVKALTMREIDVIKLTREGLSSKEIADRLNISMRTVEVHRYNVLKKLKVKNTAALIQLINTSDPGL